MDEANTLPAESAEVAVDPRAGRRIGGDLLAEQSALIVAGLLFGGCGVLDSVPAATGYPVAEAQDRPAGASRPPPRPARESSVRATEITAPTAAEVS